ncbi:nuclease-related domain-containing protein [Sellimonas intestinalis]|uniref:nuclease-related domain-containing protein n=1 Tax=Sellimonas intestinalis TaxID=1653434 RepID=UPI0015EBBECB|nr:nuclease-related domain-containing protein [Sellimonas intestinalis]MBA2213612.1 NERD domain-containing protein [Sellimonas intestinalis]
MKNVREEYYECLQNVEDSFNAEWEKEKILKRKKYTLEKAYYETKKARCFFDQYTRKILKKNWGLFDEALSRSIINYYEIFDIANENLFTPLQKWSLPKKIGDYYLTDIQRYQESFLHNNIQKLEKIYEAGYIGEKKLYEATEILGDKIKILRNIRLKVDDLEVEHDMIIIAPTGIFTIEVKNLKGNYIIDEKGIMKNVTDRRKKIYNVVDQSRRHIHNLERFFSRISSYKFNIYSIIVWANDNDRIKNKFKYIPVCYCNTLEYEIFSHKYKSVYSEKEVEYIYDILKNNALPEKEYPINIDIKEYIRNYINILFAIKYWLEIGEGKIGEEQTLLKSLGELLLLVVQTMERKTL